MPVNRKKLWKSAIRARSRKSAKKFYLPIELAQIIADYASVIYQTEKADTNGAQPCGTVTYQLSPYGGFCYNPWIIKLPPVRDTEITAMRPPKPPAGYIQSDLGIWSPSADVIAEINILAYRPRGTKKK